MLLAELLQDENLHDVMTSFHVSAVHGTNRSSVGNVTSGGGGASVPPASPELVQMRIMSFIWGK